MYIHRKKSIFLFFKNRSKSLKGKCTKLKMKLSLDSIFREDFLEEMAFTLRYKGKEASKTNVRGKSIPGSETAGAKALRWHSHGVPPRGKDIHAEQSG